MLLSVIVPLFNEEEIVATTYSRLEDVLRDVEHELIFVNDGSKDRTEEILEELIPENSANRIVSFSRNFGHQAAFSAGMANATGDAVVIIDGDLQDPPELILEMLEKWREGFQVIYAQRKKREGETFFKKFTAKAFYRLLNTFTSVNIPVDTGDYRLMDRVVVDQINNLPERSRFLRGLVCWVGYKQTGVQYDRAERSAGESKYPISKMLRLAMDGITSFSSSPLKLSLIVGFIATGVGFLAGLWALVSKFLYPESTDPGWTSLMITVIFIGGIQLITIGILGEYIGRIYDEVKQRPLYILKKKKSQKGN
jgi:dolichol-phosphate mannosyltransferase